MVRVDPEVASIQSDQKMVTTAQDTGHRRDDGLDPEPTRNRDVAMSLRS